MAPRFLVSTGFWLSGLAIATAGSVFAVNQLAHSVLSHPAEQVLQPIGSERHDTETTTSPTAQLSPTSSPTPTPTTPGPTPTTSRPVATLPTAPPVTSAAPAPQATAGTLLTSADGSVLASCQPGGAYLIYWSPAQGFEAGDVVRGPAAVASVQFEQGQTEVVMSVSCSSGSPVAHLSAG